MPEEPLMLGGSIESNHGHHGYQSSNFWLTPGWIRQGHDPWWCGSQGLPWTNDGGGGCASLAWTKPPSTSEEGPVVMGWMLRLCKPLCMRFRMEIARGKLLFVLRSSPNKAGSCPDRHFWASAMQAALVLSGKRRDPIHL